jgi:hypothetical protein
MQHPTGVPELPNPNPKRQRGLADSRMATSKGGMFPVGRG